MRQRFLSLDELVEQHHIIVVIMAQNCVKTFIENYALCRNPFLFWLLSVNESYKDTKETFTFQDFKKLIYQNMKPTQ